MLGRPDMTLRGQREALAQAASQASTLGNDVFGQAMQSAQGLIRDAQSFAPGEATPGNGITAEALAALWQGQNQGIQGEIDNVNGQLNGTDSYPQFNAGSAGEQQIYEGLMKRGFAPDEAQAAILNFMDESGLNPSITEGAPNVHGTRGQGLYQLTDTRDGVGRRSDYLRFVEQNGYKQPWDIDSQLDFFAWETQNTEKAAWDRVRAAQGVGGKASAMVEHFLRPAKEHRIARQQKYSKHG